ncbi:sensor histidine kinase [Rubellicoccus peritrichatus]|uniref:histidine kinase n=1 Tax=Rubellicoccus peritrichatus TaxID=3080537 RepID=A0AAQ3LDX6_9BACT|nr:ATP-binding protein [Puniceicoccus sp. CR14]WOO43721.1 ATP-binding protein [Puniceicoccus sp. CR14]
MLKSLRWQLQMWHGIVLTLAVIVLLTMNSVHEKDALLKMTDQQLMGVAPTTIQFYFPLMRRGLAANQFRFSDAGSERRRSRNFSSNDRPHRRSPAPIEGLNQLEDYYYAVWDDNGALTNQSEEIPESLKYPGEFERGWHFRFNNGNREMILVHPSGYLGLVGTSLSNIDKVFHTYLLWSWGSGLAIVIVSWVIGWMLVNLSLKPLNKISETAENIANGDLDQRINIDKANTELRSLVHTLNHTFGRLSKSLQNQIRFTADASHELCTPLAVMLTEIQSGLRKDRSKKEYIERLKVCHISVQHMRSLVDALMQLARIDAGESELELSTKDLKALAEESIIILETAANAKSISIQAQCESITIKVDGAKLQQVIINVLGNAIHHSPENSVIKLNLFEEKDYAIIQIQDEGPGIPNAESERIFERFYQTDDSRSQNGTGLGLAISKAIVEQHGGNIKVVKNSEPGACFVIRIPIR